MTYSSSHHRLTPRRAVLLALLGCFALFRPAAAQRSTEVRPATEPGSRLALVIGNGNYPVGPLANPGNDARAMARSLEAKGFDVTLIADGSLRAMEEAVRDFGRALRRGETGLFYYAGHGLQVQGENYLVPVDAEIEKEEDVRYEAMSVGRVLAEMDAAQNPLNLVILDACRNNPFARSWRSGTRGLAQVNAPTGTLIAYATAPGSVASDGPGQNGLYTEQLLRYMQVPGLSVEEMFKQVRIAVMDATDGQQTPWESSSLVGEFAFAAGSAPPPAAPVTAPPRTEPVSVDMAAERRALAESVALVSQGALTRLTQLGLRPARQIVHENFIDNARGWCESQENGDYLSVEGGRYLMEDSDGGRWCRTQAPHTDILIRAEVTYDSGHTNSGGGIFFRNSGWDTPRPYVIIDAAEEGGHWLQVGHYDQSLDDSWVYSVPWEQSDLLRAGANVIEVIVTGSTMSVYLNGSFSQSVAGLPVASGEYVGFMLAHSQMRYAFDDLVVVSLEPVY